MRRRKLRRQRLLGAGLAAMSIAILCLCAAWHEDATAYFMLAPLSAWLLLTGKVVIL